MKKLLFILGFCTLLFGVDISLTQTPDTNQTVSIGKEKVFGSNLFLGKFSNIKQYRFNPNYRINIGDKINNMFWGAYNAQVKTVVDSQGNIFIPQVGVVHVLGIKAGKLNDIIKNAIKKVFKSNVSVYSSVINYQPITVFVSGSLNKPGLYEGLSSDSVLQYIDKAKGINLENGSFRNIYIKREGKIVKKIDLYNFLTNGNLSMFQFKNGDVIYVSSLKYYVFVQGDVKRDYRFELKSDKTTLKQLIKFAVPDETVTNVIIYHWEKNGILDTNKIPITKINYPIYNGDKIDFLSDHNANKITIHLDGEIEGTHTIIMKKGSNLKDILNKISYSNLADKNGIQLYRKSIAILQKQLIESQLKDLRARVLTASSVTTGGATIRKEESQLILSFIAKAEKVQPKGRVLLNKDSNFSSILLENDDTIYIPKKSSIITIQGEVKIPGAQTYVKKYNFNDYINSVGGFSDRADKEHILIIKSNGKVITYNDHTFFKKDVIISPGDSILVLGKANSENLQITKDITQILYQIAVSAGVVLRLF